MAGGLTLRPVSRCCTCSTFHFCLPTCQVPKNAASAAGSSRTVQCSRLCSGGPCMHFQLEWLRLARDMQAMYVSLPKWMAMIILHSLGTNSAQGPEQARRILLALICLQIAS